MDQTRCRSHDVQSNNELSRSSVAKLRSRACPPPGGKAPWCIESTARCDRLPSSSLGEERHRRRAPPHRKAISRPLSRSSWNGVCKTLRIASYDYRIPHRHAPSTTFPYRRRSRFRISHAARSTPPCPRSANRV